MVSDTAESTLPEPSNPPTSSIFLVSADQTPPTSPKSATSCPAFSWPPHICHHLRSSFLMTFIISEYVSPLLLWTTPAPLSTSFSQDRILYILDHTSQYLMQTSAPLGHFEGRPPMWGKQEAHFLGKKLNSDITVPIQDLFLYEAHQILRKRGLHNLHANQVPSADLSGSVADVCWKAQIPARAQGMTCELFQKEVTLQAS